MDILWVLHAREGDHELAIFSLLMICRASRGEATAIKNIKFYKSALGQLINLQKSFMKFSPNADLIARSKIVTILGIPRE